MIKKTGLASMARPPKVLKAHAKSEMYYTPNPFSYGTSITLNKEELEKLGITELPEIGDEYQIIGVAKVTSASKSASTNSSDTRLELQLTHLKLTHENDAEEAKETPAKEKSEQIKPKSESKGGFGVNLGKPNALSMR